MRINKTRRDKRLLLTLSMVAIAGAVIHALASGNNIPALIALIAYALYADGLWKNS
jgi:uncharacterized membrane protein